MFRNISLAFLLRLDELSVELANAPFIAGLKTHIGPYVETQFIARSLSSSRSQSVVLAAMALTF